ncbi:hypothetical protein COEREDRAFT_81459 [Coemansia reversa NRRL 1564]|uniref:Endoplasmic reticulum-based factor for assembly of V-ATPase-domain-containing protein n=1 Tax=Coemansia reversa (strain ATCC 12441 / NRRL 1564) TaxID=763665 RepID=A0A2G5BB79_COERN|nr:hypothetical protein COEREDRAFT_81459 [Coemansia reversa NRRL 1564]|eukprot:PIA16265.1 hypothetical protein COEREDRAFT_81459 [Coemansia reversa NRRL 1564]
MARFESADSLQFTVTPRIRAACKQCVEALPVAKRSTGALSRLSAIAETKQDNATTTVALEDIRVLSQTLRDHNSECNKDNAWVHQLLCGSKIYVAQQPPPQRNPELVARLDRIKKQLEEQEYKRMTAGSTSLGSQSIGDTSTPFTAVPGVRAGQAVDAVSIRREIKDVNKSISAIVNIIFSVLGVGFAVGYASYTLTSNIGWRVLMALAAAIVTALAESWLFAFAGSRGQKKRLQRGSPSRSDSTQQ